MHVPLFSSSMNFITSLRGRATGSSQFYACDWESRLYAPPAAYSFLGAPHEPESGKHGAPHGPQSGKRCAPLDCRRAVDALPFAPLVDLGSPPVSECIGERQICAWWSLSQFQLRIPPVDVWVFGEVIVRYWGYGGIGDVGDINQMKNEYS